MTLTLERQSSGNVVQCIKSDNILRGEKNHNNCSLELNENDCVRSLEMVDNNHRAGRYTGSIDVEMRVPHGLGRMEYPDGTIYDGQWILGDWCGTGKLSTKTRLTILTKSSSRCDNNINNIEIYEGQFVKSKRHGHGITTFSDGRIFTGTFCFDKMDMGTMTYNDGSTYWGNWNQNGLRHGRGKFIYSDGRIYDGQFYNDIIEGHGRLTYPNGRWFLGEFSDGKPNGLGMEVLEDGTLHHDGMFYDGKPLNPSSGSAHLTTPTKTNSSSKFLIYRCFRGSRGILVGPLPQKR